MNLSAVNPCLFSYAWPLGCLGASCDYRMTKALEWDGPSSGSVRYGVETKVRSETQSGWSGLAKGPMGADSLMSRSGAFLFTYSLVGALANISIGYYDIRNYQPPVASARNKEMVRQLDS